jgi:hypothetical protein
LPLQRSNLFGRQQFLHLFHDCLTAECNDRTHPVGLKRKRTCNARQMRHLMTRIMIEQEYYRGATGYVGPFLVWLHKHGVPISFAANYGNQSTKDKAHLNERTARTASVLDTKS